VEVLVAARARSPRLVVVALTGILLHQSIAVTPAAAVESPPGPPPPAAQAVDPAGTTDDLVEPGMLPDRQLADGDVLSRDAFSTTVANGDGTVTQTMSVRQQNWADDNGGWHPFDNAIATRSDAEDGFAFANGRGPFSARFASAPRTSPTARCRR
jgi:hypothetical protein